MSLLERYNPPLDPLTKLQSTPPVDPSPIRQQQADRHVVVPDIHGEHRMLDKIIDHYSDQEDIDFVLLGDVIDRKGVSNDPEKGVFRTLEAIKQLGDRAIMTMANHEWLFLASSSALNPETRQQALKSWLGTNPSHSVEQNVISSYDLHAKERNQETVERLRRRMGLVGHLGVLTSAVPYYETDEFIATHAGLMPDIPWSIQRQYLHAVASEMQQGQFEDKPPQWFSMKLATSTEPILHTDKTVVSGHAHVLKDNKKSRLHHQNQRALHGGKRIRLASTLNAPTSAPAYVWQDWNQEVVEFQQ